VLFLATALYLGKGFYHLLWGTDKADAYDLNLRWTQEQYIFRWQPPSLADYPPWAFFSGAFLLWPSWEATRVLFAVVNLFALLGIGLWAYKIGRPLGRWEAFLLLFSALALSSYCTTLEIGQYGILVVAFLVFGLAAVEQGQPVLGGLLIGIAMMKPTISGPFLIPLLIKKRYTALASATAYLIGATLLIWYVTQMNPVAMLKQMADEAKGYSSTGYGLVNLVYSSGLDQKVATPVVGLGVIAVTALVMFAGSSRDLLTQFAIASVAGRFWVHHKGHDNLGLVFLLVALASVALKTRRFWPTLGFLAVGASLWAPPRWQGSSFDGTDNVPYQVAQCLVWVGGLIILYQATSPRAVSKAEEPLPSPAIDSRQVLAT
jgi:hypothetical protein